MRLTYKAQDQNGKETGTVWYASTAGDSIFPKSDKEEQVLKKLAAYEDTGYSPLEIKSLEGEWKAMRKVVDSYRAAEDQGRLVILPEKLYGFYEWDVTGVRYYDGKVTAYCVKNEQVESIIYASEIGKTVFLSREEAEAALKGEGKDV